MPILHKVVYIGSTLVDMYVKCGSLENALAVLDTLHEKDVVTWNTIIAGCAQHHFAQEALQLFQKMLESRLEPDQVTLASTLKACSSIKSVEEGRLIHVYSVEHGYEMDLPVSNSLIDMYAKCGCVDAALNVFKRLPKRDVASWSVITAECAQDEQGQMTLQLFPRMEQDGIVADHAMFLCVLKACTSAVAFHQGKQIHAHFVESGLDLSADSSIANTLIDMYCKCGSLEDAVSVFKSLPKRDLVTWNTIIGGCAQWSNCDVVLKYCRLLQQEGHEPDSITFISLLCACNHLGLVKVACHHFNSMGLIYGISPTPEHYNCMVDLLSHWGHLKEAEDFLLVSPVKSDVVGWASLLNQSQLHENIALAHRCFDYITSIKGRNASGFMSMSHACFHVYGDSEASVVEQLRSSSNAWKKPGLACIAIGYEVHAFNVGGKSHLQCSAKARRLGMQMKEVGYFPHLETFLQSPSKENMATESFL